MAQDGTAPVRQKCPEFFTSIAMKFYSPNTNDAKDEICDVD